LSEIPAIPIGNLYIPGVDTAVLSTTYINLMKATVLNMIYEPDPTKITGEKWPGANTMTMVGLRRINNVQALMEDTIINNIPGDFIETGAWRGGVCAFAAAIFTAYGQWKTRNVWIADSFKGIPPVNITEYPQDKPHIGSDKWTILTNNPAGKVQDMFKALDLYRPEVKWLIGWFKDTLPRFQKEDKNTKFSIIRLDGDIYESTIQALTFLYPSLSVGGMYSVVTITIYFNPDNIFKGYTIIDDFTDWHGCRTAVLDFRKACGITDEDSPITLTYHKKGEPARGVWWKKVTPIKPDCWKALTTSNL
jgi:hypothetical protein